MHSFAAAFAPALQPHHEPRPSPQLCPAPCSCPAAPVEPQFQLCQSTFLSMAEILFRGKFLIFLKSMRHSGPVSGVIFSKKSPVDTKQTIQDSEAASGHTRCVLSFLLYFQMCLESQLESGLATSTCQRCHGAWGQAGRRGEEQSWVRGVAFPAPAGHRFCWWQCRKALLLFSGDKKSPRNRCAGRRAVR